MVVEALCVGFASLDVVLTGWIGFPPPGDHTRFFDSGSLSAGGDAANQARVLAKLGHEVGLATAVGDDLAGHTVRAALSAAGVDCSLVATRKDAPTSLCLIDLKSDGERAFAAPLSGMARVIGPTEVDPKSLPQGVRVVSVGSLNWSRELDQLVLPELLARARAEGAIVVADMVSDHPDVRLDQLAPVLRQVDYLMPSELEAFLYTGRVVPAEVAEAFLQYGVGAVVLKQGAQGATMVRSGVVTHCPAFPVDAVDTTGAGDSFVAGFVSGLLRELPPEDCLRFASATAAISVSSRGTATGVLNGPSGVLALVGQS